MQLWWNSKTSAVYTADVFLGRTWAAAFYVFGGKMKEMLHAFCQIFAFVVYKAVRTAEALSLQMDFF